MPGKQTIVANSQKQAREIQSEKNRAIYLASAGVDIGIVAVNGPYEQLRYSFERLEGSPSVGLVGVIAMRSAR